MIAALFAAAALMTGAASLFAARPWLKAGAYCALVVAMGVTWWASLGRPRPILPLLGIPAGTVAAFSLDEPRAIYVWLMPPGARVPVALALPWNERDAAALHRAMRASQRLGTRVKMHGGQRPAGASGTPMLRRDGPVFYPAPTPPLPPKQRP